VRAGDRIESGVLGCECCAFPVVAGIPVMIADDPTREAMHLLEAGQGEAALFTLLGLDGGCAEAFRGLLAGGARATYQEALALLCRDAEGTCFVYRFSDPTYVMAEALLQAIGRPSRTPAGRSLDLCGGTGHLTRVLIGLRPAGGTVLADLFFWKLWLARRFTAPQCEPVCCDANQPLPFAREAFSLVVLADAFPYIWHKRLLADEMMRLTVSDGLIVMPHLHSALGENFSAGNTLTPAAYRDLFAPRRPRLFSDELLLTQVLERRVVDLTHDASPADLGTEPSLTLVAGGRADVFQRYELPAAQGVMGELRVNPLYRVERHGGSSILTLTFPTPEYEEEFGACRRYLPDSVIVDADLTGTILPAMLGSRAEELRRRRIIFDAPPNYC
jgi:SAM-dependent methyltransferase